MDDNVKRSMPTINELEKKNVSVFATPLQFHG